MTYPLRLIFSIILLLSAACSPSIMQKQPENTSSSSTSSFACTDSASSNNFYAGAGTIGSPYQVCSAAQLNRVRNFLDKNFLQITNIDVSASANGEAANWFAPISGVLDKSDIIGSSPNNTPSAQFSGVYNGGSYKISNWSYVAQSENEKVLMALFPVNSGTIKNLNLENFSITAYAISAGLVGINSGTIQNITVSGTVVYTGYAGALTTNYGGGAIPIAPAILALLAAVSVGPTVSGVDVSGTINAPLAEHVAGGIALVTDAINVVTMSNIVGHDLAITGKGIVGGIFGEVSLVDPTLSARINLSASSVSNSTVTSSAAGTLFPTSVAAGFSGYEFMGTISDITVSGVTVNSNEVASGLASDANGFFSNLNVSSVTLNSAYSTAGMFGNMTGGTITQSHVTGLTINATDDGASQSRLAGFIGSVENATSITNSSVSNSTIIGTGNRIAGFIFRDASSTITPTVSDCTVSNVSITGTDYLAGLIAEAGNTVGLFTITNSSVSGTTIIATSGGYVAGFIATDANLGISVSGCSVTNSTITGLGDRTAGFIAEMNVGTITSSYVSGTTTVSAPSNTFSTGGFVGNIPTTTAAITSSYTSGVTVSGGSQVGGFIGVSAGPITSSYSLNSTVTGLSLVGGFVGEITGSTINLSYSSAPTIIATIGNVGGFVGSMTQTSTVTNSYALNQTTTFNQALAATSNNVGGFAGYVNDDTAALGGIISGSYSRGGTITFNANTGNLGSYAAGFVGNTGSTDLVNISNSYSTGITITGVPSAGTLNTCGFAGYFSGSLTGTYVIGNTMSGGNGGNNDNICSRDGPGSTYTNNYAQLINADLVGGYTSKLAADFIQATGTLTGITDDASGAQAVWKWSGGAYVYPIQIWQ